MAYGDYGMANALAGGGMLAFLAAFLVIFLIVAVALYVYFALVLSTLAKKMGKKDLAWLAWVPIANLAMFPILAKKEWPWVFILLIPIVNIVFLIIWTWAIFEARKYPGWLSLLPILGFIPVIGWIVDIGSLVLWGLVAWRDQ